jgi:glycosyltransferase involved in cell wall biosynthesis
LKDKHIHIVSLDVPYPPNYGGVVDLFYKLPALHEQGIKIHLHCFEYGRGEQSELNKYCESVRYYQRAEGHKGFSFSIPYIVASRSNPSLWANIQQDNFPVLLEGIHCTYGLHAGLLKDRRVILRLHNVEHEYYKQLSKWEASLVKKTYFHHESRLLKRYEKEIAPLCDILTVSEKDMRTYQQTFGAKQISYLPVFTGHEKITSQAGSGNFALYHGNLSVSENEKAAVWLLEKVFHDLDIPLVIAGKDPSPKLTKLSHQKVTTCLIANPSEAEMQDLISKAQMHIMPSFTDSGIKLKLINALFNGRHVIVNPAMVEGTGLDKMCHIAGNITLMKYHIYRLFQTPFTEEDIEKRRAVLSSIFNRQKNTDILIRRLFD